MEKEMSGTPSLSLNALLNSSVKVMLGGVPISVAKPPMLQAKAMPIMTAFEKLAIFCLP